MSLFRSSAKEKATKLEIRIQTYTKITVYSLLKAHTNIHFKCTQAP